MPADEQSVGICFPIILHLTYHTDDTLSPALRQCVYRYAQSQPAMNAEEYKSLINQKDVLDNTTLNVTLKELVSRQEFEIAASLKRILQNNQIVKPLLHTDPYSVSTTYCRVDLSSDDIDKIIDIFFDLEAAHVRQDSETTPTASFYASLVDKWNKIAEG